MHPAPDRPQKIALKPFKGLGNVKFGMSIREVQKLVGTKQSELTNKWLQERAVTVDGVKYTFQKDVLMLIEVDYQPGIYLDDVALFDERNVDTLLKGYETASRKDAIHIPALGLVLFKFKLKDLKKRYLWFYSKPSIEIFEDVLEIV